MRQVHFKGVIKLIKLVLLLAAKGKVGECLARTKFLIALSVFLCDSLNK